MMRLPISAMLLAPFMLAACAVEPVVVEEEPSLREAMQSDDPCGAENYQQFVGEKSPAISLPAGTMFRHYRSGDPITMDMAPTRLNFEYDRTGTLVKVSCG